MKFHDISYFDVNKSPFSINFDWTGTYNRERLPKLSKCVVFIFSNWSIQFQKIQWRQNLKMHIDAYLYCLPINTY